ncbi:DUF4468 domain-containing protein [Chryseobacterium sp.]|uniref:DUF4468 domain-containing protein n=1 Tax=Chryseobacterium sp. TaxID=1871047 RepID=UPI00321A786E
MKRLYAFPILFFSIIVFSQELKFEEVIQTDSSLTKEELFSRAKTWAGQNFKSGKNSITTEDAQLGEISGVGEFDYRADKKYMGYSCIEGPLSYKFSIYLKDGKYKYSFNSFIHNGSGGPGCKRVDYGQLTLSEKPPVKGKMIADDYAWMDIKEKAEAKIKPLITQLNEVMKKPHETNNDW